MLREIVIRYRETEGSFEGLITTPDALARYTFEALELAFGTPDRECLICVAVDQAGHPVGHLRLDGTTGEVVADLPTVLGLPLKLGVIRFALAHVHPSGNTDPSSADLHFTSKVRDGSKLLGLDFVDHVIVTSACYWRSVCFGSVGKIKNGNK